MERPPKTADSRRLLVWTGVLLIALGWSYHGVGTELPTVFSTEGLAQVRQYVEGLFPPDLSNTLLVQAAWGAAETFAISLIGTLLAVLIGAPLALAASRTLSYSGVLFLAERSTRLKQFGRIGGYWSARCILNLLRTVPELLWALIFVFLAGLGPFPGVLALGVHTGGILGKLFAETIEDSAPVPLEALQSTGASRLQIVAYGVLPQILPQVVSYTLYRWEVNIRAAAVLGFVGAGGLGQQIHIALNLFWQHQLLTYLLVLYLLVTCVDALSAWLRQKLL